MKRSIVRSLFSSLIGFGLLLILLSTAGSAGAQGADVRSDGARPGDVSAATPLTSTFTYQGQLKRDGKAVTGSCQMTFGLYDDPATGGQIGSPINANVPVSNGLFTVGLDFGSSAFDGSGRWLAIQVDCGSGSGLVALPRQSLTAVPYALYAMDGWGGVWTGSGTGLTLSGGSAGLDGSGTDFGVHGQSDAYGVYGYTNGTTGVGVRGYSEATTGENYGVSGKNFSPSGFGVYGEAPVYGVKGEATATSGSTFGVYGKSASDTGVGVIGQGNTGVEGYTTATNGVGVYGTAQSQGNGTTTGVYGSSLSANGTGVSGNASALNGNTVGVKGLVNSPTGHGVEGIVNSLSGVNYGVYGATLSSQGYGGYFVNGVKVVGSLDVTSNVRANDLNVTGTVGIGVTNPTKAKVEISGILPNTIPGTNALYGPTGTGSTFSSTALAYSLYASNDIAAFGFVAFSDERMKRIEGRSDAARDLATLMGIEVTDYTYIDTVTKGAGEQKKVIAQQVETVYPQAVNHSTDVVPDIYQKAPIKDGWVTLATDLQKGERVRLIGEKTEGIYEVLDVTSDGFRTDFAADGESVFVYGREVKDFRSVDYDAIAMLDVSATQELNRLVQQQAAEIEALNARLAALEQAASSGDATSRAQHPTLP